MSSSPFLLPGVDPRIRKEIKGNSHPTIHVAKQNSVAFLITSHTSELIIWRTGCEPGRKCVWRTDSCRIGVDGN